MLKDTIALSAWERVSADSNVLGHTKRNVIKTVFNYTCFIVNIRCTQYKSNPLYKPTSTPLSRCNPVQRGAAAIQVW